jgi:hypothetical protein
VIIYYLSEGISIAKVASRWTIVRPLPVHSPDAVNAHASPPAIPPDNKIEILCPGIAVPIKGIRQFSGIRPPFFAFLIDAKRIFRKASRGSAQNKNWFWI